MVHCTEAAPAECAEEQIRSQQALLALQCVGGDVQCAQILAMERRERGESRFCGARVVGCDPWLDSDVTL